MMENVAKIGAPTPSDAQVENMNKMSPNERFETMWEDHAFTMTLATMALPFGIFFAVFGRKHHTRLTLALTGVICAWLGLMGLETVRNSLESVSDHLTIPDTDMLNYGVAAVCGLIGVSVMMSIYKLLGLVIGVSCGWLVNSLAESYIDYDFDMMWTAGFYAVGAVLGWVFVSPFIMDKIGIVYAIIGGGLIATSGSLFLWLGGVVESPDLWPIDLTKSGDAEVQLNRAHFDFQDYTNYYSIAIALVFVYIGLCTGGRGKKGPDETSPLLGDAEKGQAEKK